MAPSIFFLFWMATEKNFLSPSLMPIYSMDTTKPQHGYSTDADFTDKNGVTDMKQHEYATYFCRVKVS